MPTAVVVAQRLGSGFKKVTAAFVGGIGAAANSLIQTGDDGFIPDSFIHPAPTLAPATFGAVAPAADTGEVMLRGGAPVFAVNLSPPSNDGYVLRLRLEEGSSQGEPSVLLVPQTGASITDGYRPALPYPMVIRMLGARASLVWSAPTSTWTLAGASGVAPTPPALSLDFQNASYSYGYLGTATARTFGFCLAYTAPANATYVDATGVMRDASTTAGVMRETYGSWSRSYLGWLLEPASQNLVPLSASPNGDLPFTAANGATPVASTDYPAFYQGAGGNASVYKVAPDQYLSQGGALQMIASPVAGAIYTISWFVLVPYLFPGASVAEPYMDTPTAGWTILYQPLSRNSIFADSYRRGHWRRMAMVVQAPASSPAPFVCRLRFYGLGTAPLHPNVYVTCPQAELGSFPTSFIPNPTSTLNSRAADAPTSTMALDVTFGGTFLAETASPPEFNFASAPGGGVGIRDNATPSVAGVKLRQYGDPNMPFADFAATSYGAQTSRLVGAQLLPHQTSKSAFAIADTDFEYQDSNGARLVDTSGPMPSGIATLAIEPAAPVLLRGIQFIPTRVSSQVLRRLTWHTGPHTLTADPSSPAAAAIPLDFVGLSFEESFVAAANGFSAAYASWLVNALGQAGSIRVGGASSDLTNSTTTPTTAQIQTLISMMQALPSGWSLLFCLAGKRDTTSQSVAIAQQLVGALGVGRITFKVSNEPDLLATVYPAYSDYKAAFQSVYNAVTGAIAGTKWAAPGVAVGSDYVEQFMTDFGSSVGVICHHCYANASSHPEFASAPVTFSRPYVDSVVGAIGQLGTQFGKPCRMTEAGSTNGTNTFIANALSGAAINLSMMAQVAAAGWLGVNWHGGASGGYSPLLLANGAYYAQATMYAMKLFSYLVGGKVVPIATKAPAHIQSLGVLGTDGKTRVLLINKDPRRTALVNLASTKGALTSGSTLLLAAPDMRSTALTLGGATFDTAGNVAPTAIPVTASGGLVPVALPPASSAVVTLA